MLVCFCIPEISKQYMYMRWVLLHVNDFLLQILLHHDHLCLRFLWFNESRKVPKKMVECTYQFSLQARKARLKFSYSLNCISNINRFFFQVRLLSEYDKVCRKRKKKVQCKHVQVQQAPVQYLNCTQETYCNQKESVLGMAV